jgi:hypothetical protein
MNSILLVGSTNGKSTFANTLTLCSQHDTRAGGIEVVETTVGVDFYFSPPPSTLSFAEVGRRYSWTIPNVVSNYRVTHVILFIGDDDDDDHSSLLLDLVTRLEHEGNITRVVILFTSSLPPHVRHWCMNGLSGKFHVYDKRCINLFDHEQCRKVVDFLLERVSTVIHDDHFDQIALTQSEAHRSSTSWIATCKGRKHKRSSDCVVL